MQKDITNKNKIESAIILKQVRNTYVYIYDRENNVMISEFIFTVYEIFETPCLSMALVIQYCQLTFLNKSFL